MRKPYLDFNRNVGKPLSPEVKGGVPRPKWKAYSIYIVKHRKLQSVLLKL